MKIQINATNVEITITDEQGNVIHHTPNVNSTLIVKEAFNRRASGGTPTAEALASGNEWVYDNAQVSNNAWVYGEARVLTSMTPKPDKDDD